MICIHGTKYIHMRKKGKRKRSTRKSNLGLIPAPSIKQMREEKVIGDSCNQGHVSYSDLHTKPKKENI